MGGHLWPAWRYRGGTPPTSGKLKPSVPTWAKPLPRKHRPVSSLPVLPDVSVLHAESGPFFRSIMRDILLRVGLKQFYEADEPADIFSCLGGRTPDVTILDWDFPGLSGEEVLRLIRNPKLSPVPRMPVIVTMARPTRDAVLRAVEVGANEIVAKPFSPKVVWQHLQGIVQEPRLFMDSGGILVPAP